MDRRTCEKGQAIGCGIQMRHISLHVTFVVVFFVVAAVVTIAVVAAATVVRNLFRTITRLGQPISAPLYQYNMPLALKIG